MLISLTRDQGGSVDAPTAVATYRARPFPSLEDVSLDALAAPADDAYLVVIVPSLDNDGFDDAMCLRDNAIRIDQVTGERVLVILPFVRGELDEARPLEVAKNIRDDLVIRGFNPPASTFALYLSVQETEDGADVIGHPWVLPKLDETRVRSLTQAWADAARELATEPDRSPGSFACKAHGGMPSQRFDWESVLMGINTALENLERWLSLVGGIDIRKRRALSVSSVNARPQGTLEDLIDELARVLHIVGEARELAQRAGFPVADLPDFDTSSVFWSRVVRAADDGKTVGGVGAIVDQARARFPGNQFFTAYGSSTSAPTSSPTLLEAHGGPSIDHRGANIGQQIVVHGNATFGAMSISMSTPGGPSQGSGDRGARPATQSPVPPPRVDDLGERPRASDGSVDVVIITAAEGEDTALLEVSDGALSPWTRIPSPEGYAGEVYRATFDSLACPGRPIHVVTIRPSRMGGDHAANAAGLLVGAFKPRCIAMCGVCAGRPEWTQLGDVLIAERVWRYDTGERVNAVPGGRPAFKKDTELFQLSAKWLRAAENAAREWKAWPGGDDAWLRARPRPLELQALWLMQELAEGRDPKAHPEAERLCASWPDVVEQLERDGLVDDGAPTEAGRKHLRGVLFKHKGGLPEQADWAVHVGPVATGNYLVRDVDIWQELEDEQRLVRGFDMELAAIGLAGWASEIPFLAVKGVMDFGLPDRHRGFRPFAARASAEVLVRLLRTLVEPLPGRTVAKKGGKGIDNLDERPPIFEGRDDELKRIRETPTRGNTEAVFSVVVGLGGVGKSRLVLEYALEGDYDVR